MTPVAACPDVWHSLSSGPADWHSLACVCTPCLLLDMLVCGSRLTVSPRFGPAR